MRLLLVNDDGANAPGIQILARAAAAYGHKVTIYAPDRERSGAGHSMSAMDVMTVKRLDINDGIETYQVNGSPADCLRIGAFLMKNQVDFVLSGINNGPNLGTTVVCSGTVHAALEAAMIGLPAAAVSMGQFPCDHYKTAAEVTMRLLPWLVEHPLPQGCIYNLNVPNRPMGEVRGVRLAALSHGFYSRVDYSPAEGGWRPVIIPPDEETNENCDAVCIRKGYVSITALTWDMEMPLDEKYRLSPEDLKILLNH